MDLACHMSLLLLFSPYDVFFSLQSMEGGAACFRKEVVFVMQIQGSVNGHSFSIEGRGSGDSHTGNVKGRWQCTTGKLPISWAAIASTLAGYR